MNGIYLTSVTRKNKSTNSPKLTFFAEWLVHMGFVPGALVQFLPEPGGLSLILCEYVPKYSELFHSTKEKGGTLIHANLNRQKGYACFSIEGAALNSTGLCFGDALLARYEPGFIRLRKLPAGNVKVVTAKLFGQWLEEIGFLAEAVFTVDAQAHPGLITCQLQENGLERSLELVRHARKNKLALLQVPAILPKNCYPMFEIPPACLERAGLAGDEYFLALYEHGRIQLQKLDFVGLGF